MVVVKIELWPGGCEHLARELGRMTLTNTGEHPGHPRRGDYVARLMRKGAPKTVLRTAEVLDYPRLSYPIWKLLRRALEALSI